MFDISVFMPAIRTHNWLMLYGSLQNSCKKHSFELVMVSPFDLPEDMKHFKNIKLIKDYGAPSRCAQIAALHCEGKLVYHCVDDAIFLPNAIDKAIEQYNEICGKKDVINMRYREGVDYCGQSMPMGYWHAWFHDPLRLPGILPHYKISCHHMLDSEYFKELGGYDCQYEYVNHGLHDLMFRIQADGGKLYDSSVDVTTCDHYINKTVDHGPVADAQDQHDRPKFDELYSQNNIAQKRIYIDLDNWKNCPEVWDRRFKREKGKLPGSYKELGYE